MVNNNKPLVSIVTATYNSEKFLQDTIESVLSQDYENIEYIIVDGGSTDNTIKIISQYEDSFGNRLKWISEEDKGIYDAFNKGISLSSGDIIGIINSDDWYENNIITEVVQEIKNYDMLHGNLRFYDAEGKILKIYSQKKGSLRKYISTPFNHPTMFVKKYVYESIGAYSLEYEYAADYDFMLRFINSAYKEIYINRILANMRTVGVTTSAPYVVAPGEIKSVLAGNGLPKTIASLFVYYRVLRSKIFDLCKDSTLLIQIVRKLKPYHIKKD